MNNSNAILDHHKLIPLHFAVLYDSMDAAKEETETVSSIIL